MSIHLLPEYDCVKCTDRQKVLRGCEGKPQGSVTEMDGQKLDRCPRRVLLDHPQDVNEIFWYYQNYKRGLLPVAGGLLDQPALMMQCFAVIDGAMATIEADAAEKLKSS